MFERFTDRARGVVVKSNELAKGMKHGYIGSEHLLLALVMEPESLAGRTLADHGITEHKVRTQIEKIIGLGDSEQIGNMPFTPRAKKVLELAIREALQLGQNYISTKHLLLSIIREGEGVACQVIVKLGVDLSTIRAAIAEKSRNSQVDPKDVFAERLVISQTGTHLYTSREVTNILIRAAQLAQSEQMELTHVKQALQEIESA